jgi:hypothetical protein
LGSGFRLGQLRVGDRLIDGDEADGVATGTGLGGGEGKRTGKKHGFQTFTTKGLPVPDATGRKQGFGSGAASKPSRPVSARGNRGTPQGKR